MYFTGFADEAGRGIDTQIRATLELGWRNMESRNIDGVNIHNISEDQFEDVCIKLSDAGIHINCFGSEVANWAKDPLSDEAFEQSKQELKRALVRMGKLETKMIRAMSFRRFNSLDEITPEIEKRIFMQVEYLVKMCEDAGALYVHENCMNYGGMCWQNTLKLIENVKSDALKLVFDTGNPVMTYDYAKPTPWPKQSSWEFYSNVKEFIEYVHIKDPVYIDEGEAESVFPRAEHQFPGEGNGDVVKIVKDLISSGYEGGFSIEPHMSVVFHEESSEEDRKLEQYNIYIEFGQRLMNIVE